MARAIWNGAISFGLVTIPVQLVSAVRSQRPRFHLLHAKDESPVRYERVCERESKPVPWEQIVKGYEYEKGEYAVLTKEDFKRAALEKTDTIDVLSFVPASAIDARYFETPYYVVPGKGGDRAYALLRETMRKTGKVGVAQLILRQSQHLAALSVKDDVFVLTLLRLADDWRRRIRSRRRAGRGCATTSCSSRRGWSTGSRGRGSRSSTRINTRRTCPRSSRRRSRARGRSPAWARSVRASRRRRWRI